MELPVSNTVSWKSAKPCIINFSESAHPGPDSLGYRKKLLQKIKQKLSEASDV